MLFRTAFLAALAFVAVRGDQEEAQANAAAASNARGWTIGPIIRGRNYSEGAPLHPVPRRSGGWQVDNPQRPTGIHYVTFRHGSLAGKRRIVKRYRIGAAPGVKIVPATAPHLPSSLTLYFQRAGDNWRGRRQFETYRWYATF